MWFAFGGAALASVAVYAIAARGRGGATPVKLALGGAAINALLVSVTMGVLTTKARTGRVPLLAAVRSPGRRTGPAGVAVPPGRGRAVLSVARGLDALALGEDVAKGLGQNVAAVRIVGGIGATVLTGVGVAAAGPIAFIGLPSRTSPAPSSAPTTAGCCPWRRCSGP
ncbi:iron ABC transporter permease [Streptomyces californicus]